MHKYSPSISVLACPFSRLPLLMCTGLLCIGSLLLGSVQAQKASTTSTKLTLNSSVSRALSKGTDTNNARANLNKSWAHLKAVKADPTSLITTITTAQHDADLQKASLTATKLNVAREVIGAYVNAYEVTELIKLNQAKVALDQRTLNIAKARLASKVATQLDVNRAQTGLNNSVQKLASAKAQLPVAQAQLARLLGLPTSGKLVLARPAAAPRLNVTLDRLQTDLEKRQPALVQAYNGVRMAKLQVKLSDNDYTPARTLQDAQVLLETAERSLADGKRSALTTVRDAYRNVDDAQERVSLAQQQTKNASTNLEQARTRLQAGTAAAIEVQRAEVELLEASVNVQKAQNGLWQTLAGLGSASVYDVSGLVK